LGGRLDKDTASEPRAGRRSTSPGSVFPSLHSVLFVDWTRVLYARIDEGTSWTAASPPHVLSEGPRKWAIVDFERVWSDI
jgi:hypothetical protein